MVNFSAKVNLLSAPTIDKKIQKVQLEAANRYAPSFSSVAFVVHGSSKTVGLRYPEEGSSSLSMLHTLQEDAAPGAG